MTSKMMQHAKKLWGNGFHVFPVKVGTKDQPLIKGFPEVGRASIDVQEWWTRWPNANIGISTSKFLNEEALIVIDVDNKNGKDGSSELLKLELEGKEFPKTYTQTTPSGGIHLVYRHSRAVRQGVSVLGPGLDIRSQGGYILGSGSTTGMGAYTGNDVPVAPAPQWLVDACGAPRERDSSRVDEKTVEGIDQDTANQRAITYLATQAPPALSGEGGNQTTFAVAARVKDLGVALQDAILLMDQYYNHRCAPPWSLEELTKITKNAYKYGGSPVGVDAPETQFEPLTTEKVLHPFEELNKEFAFVVAGGGSHILWETKDQHGNPKLEHLGLQTFENMLASRFLSTGDGKMKPLTELWMTSPKRRSYDGIVFSPGRKVDPRFYNLWRGFAVEPYPKDTGIDAGSEAAKSLDMFLEHALINVCKNDKKLYEWLITYFAHLIQKPWEKPLVALVFRGPKGVGKNALIDRIGHLLGNHYLLASNRRYLVGNFNGHLENCLLFALDEAFWSGDKQSEGTLKDLITGKHHVIEHKGKEPYKVENCTRVVIIGNEDWLVPATQDERRFAVFDVGSGRKQDRDYFRRMREGMEAGGYRLLLRFLMDYPLQVQDGSNGRAKYDVNLAPQTEALHDQKLASLDPFYQWWLDCLHAGRVGGVSEFEVVGGGGEASGDGWSTEVDKESFRQAFRRYVKERNIHTKWLPDDRTLGKMLKVCLPELDTSHKRREGDSRVNVYRIPTLEGCRKSWERFIGHAVKWE